MIKFLKENWFKVGIIVAIFTVALSTAYYLIIFLPQEDLIQHKTSIDQSNIEKCSQQAQVALKNAEQNQDSSTTVSATNHYNEKLGKCLVNINSDTTYNGSVTILNDIVEALEQKTLLECASGSNVKSYCFIPGNVSTTGQAIFMTDEEGQVRIRDFMNN